MDWWHDLKNHGARKAIKGVLAATQDDDRWLREWASAAQQVIAGLDGFDHAVAALERNGATPTEQHNAYSRLDNIHKRAVQMLEEFSHRNLEHSAHIKTASTPRMYAFLRDYAKRFEAVKLSLIESGTKAHAVRSELAQTRSASLSLILRVVNLRTWYRMNGVEFEDFIIRRLRLQGFDAQNTKRSGDEGIDIVAVLTREPIGRPLVTAPTVGTRFLFQCKRYSPDHHIGQPPLRDFYGSVKAFDPSARGVFITTSSFTAPAVAFAAKMGIELVGGSDLDDRLEIPAPARNGESRYAVPSPRPAGRLR
jgi:restriction endonuclease Mrr